ncbi:hypothetical protein BKA63DRAFT_520351 [Paraphoma chrysanthemicola]|nr:hypothetical protein BKA63DRAFT_520351 [Paraphoma chrysanthemicola]
MPGYLGLQLSLDLSNILPIKDGVVAAGSYLLSLARDLKTSGSDIVVEEDVASIFGRGTMRPDLEKKFRDIVSVTTIKPLSNGLPIELHSGPGPTVVRALSKEGQYYLRTVITLSFLDYFVDRMRLATMISEGITKRFENRIDHEYRNPGIESINAMLIACSTQTASFSWASYRLAVEQIFQSASSYRFQPDYLSLTPALMLGSMDFLYSVQSLPKNRHITISNQKGWIIIVIWAHYLLGLNVEIVRGSERIVYGDGAEPNITIYWSEKAYMGARRDISVQYPLEDKQSEVEIHLYDESMSVQLGCAPEDGEQRFCSVRERHPLAGWGTTYLRRLLNTGRITIDTDPIFDEIPNLITGLAVVASQNRVRYAQVDVPPPDETNPVKHILRAPNVEIEVWRVLAAGEMIFRGLGLDKDSVASYQTFFSKTRLDKATLPSACSAYLRGVEAGPEYIYPSSPDERLILQIAHLAEMVLLFSHIHDLQKCADMPIIIEGLPQRSQKSYYHVLTANEINHGKVRPEDVFNELVYFLSASHRPQLDNEKTFLAEKRIHSFLYSDFGWSVFLDTVMEKDGTKDPEGIRLDLIHVEKGTPTNSKTNERRYCMKDAEDYEVPWPDEWEVERGAKYKPRAVGQVIGAREFWSTKLEHFELKIQVDIRHPLPRWEKRAWREKLGCRAMHDALWRVFFTPPCKCPHMSDPSLPSLPTQKEIKLGPDAAAILGWSHTKGMRCSEKIIIYLTLGNCHLRWVALARTRMSLQRNVALRTSACCEECALQYVASQPSKWVLIL